MLEGFFGIFKFFVELLKYPFFVLLGIFVLFVVICTFFIMKELFKGRKLPKINKNILPKSNLLIKLFYELPKQFVVDLFNKQPDFFPYQGLVIFEGRQGTGKSISMIEYLMRMQFEYPKCKVITNMAYKNENDVLKGWEMLMDYKNGIKGVVVVMDELQNWFSSKDSKDFPPEMLSVITQNRKNRRIILGTSQNFYLLAKAIRSQATEVRRCATFLGCFTIVRRFEPILDSEGNVVKFKNRGMYCFVHNKELRESYDTWKVIENLRKSGFKENNNYLESNSTNNYYILKNKSLKKLKR